MTVPTAAGWIKLSGRRNSGLPVKLQPAIAGSILNKRPNYNIRPAATVSPSLVNIILTSAYSVVK